MILEENNTFEYIDFTLTPTVSAQARRLMWDGSTSLIINGGLKLTEDGYIKCDKKLYFDHE